LNELVWLSTGAEFRGSSTEKTVDLFAGRTCKPVFEKKGRDLMKS
jgi:hypothetical protein